VRASVEDHIADVFDAAIVYVRAREQLAQADSAGLTDAQNVVQLRWHDLVLAVNDECTICDAGTCPGMIG